MLEVRRTAKENTRDRISLLLSYGKARTGRVRTGRRRGRLRTPAREARGMPTESTRNPRGMSVIPVAVLGSLFPLAIAPAFLFDLCRSWVVIMEVMDLIPLFLSFPEPDLDEPVSPSHRVRDAAERLEGGVWNEPVRQILVAVAVAADPQPGRDRASGVELRMVSNLIVDANPDHRLPF